MVIDLYAGSGSFAIEALSRGARSATCVEQHLRMIDILERNLTLLNLNKSCHVLHMDVRYAIPFLYKRLYRYDIIFLDPPYGEGLIADTMALLEEYPLYTENSLVIAEYSKREDTAFFNRFHWRTKTVKHYGDTVVRILD